MQTIDAIKVRRAVKRFDPEHALSEAERQTLLSNAILAPTAFDIQNWRFVVVKNSDLRKPIREVAWDQAQVTDASLFVIL